MKHRIERHISLHVENVAVHVRNRLVRLAFAQQKDGTLQIYSWDFLDEINTLREDGDEIPSQMVEIEGFILEAHREVNGGCDVYLYTP